jgi:hypothetical protein
MKPCIPPDMQAKADAAARRKEQAVERLANVGADMAPDSFEQAMRALIDADKAAVPAIRKGKRE